MKYTPHGRVTRNIPHCQSGLTGSSHTGSVVFGGRIPRWSEVAHDKTAGFPVFIRTWLVCEMLDRTICGAYRHGFTDLLRGSPSCSMVHIDG
ncbi:hypothetical protein RSAG8_03612, partial [Rhizoctonia solani AG-8 WAC10335]